MDKIKLDKQIPDIEASPKFGRSTWIGKTIHLYQTK